MFYQTESMVYVHILFDNDWIELLVIINFGSFIFGFGLNDKICTVYLRHLFNDMLRNFKRFYLKKLIQFYINIYFVWFTILTVFFRNLVIFIKLTIRSNI